MRSLLHDIAKEGFGWYKRPQIYRIAGTVAAILGYSFILTDLGFVSSTFLLMLFMFRIIFSLGWRMSSLTALITSLCAYLLFKVWLGVQLPAGYLGM